MMTQINQVFEGTLVASGWDRSNRMRKACLYTFEGEDIVLEHPGGMEKFRPYMNKRVRVRGRILADSDGGLRIIVKRINRLQRANHDQRPLDYDEFHVSDTIALSA